MTYADAAGQDRPRPRWARSRAVSAHDLADDHELAPLRAALRRDRVQVDAAHHVLAIARDQVPARLAIARSVLLPVDVLVRATVRVDHGRPAGRGVDGIVPAQCLHEVTGERVDLDR